MQQPPAEHGPSRRRWSGIRTQLLVLLLPAIALILAVDSWSDHQDRTRILDSAYDEALLEPISVLDDNVQIKANGEVDLTVPFAVQTMFASVPALHKHLHVGLTQLDPVGGVPREERTLMGVNDLPDPPADAKPMMPPASFGAARGSRIIFYTATYRGYPLRIATLQRNVEDAVGAALPAARAGRGKHRPASGCARAFAAPRVEAGRQRPGPDGVAGVGRHRVGLAAAEAPARIAAGAPPARIAAA